MSATSLDISLGQALDQLIADLALKKNADPHESYTARLLRDGPMAAAKKLGEEGVETALAVAAGTPAQVAVESADLLYHLAVSLMSREVDPAEVGAVLAARRGLSGLAEKAARATP